MSAGFDRVRASVTSRWRAARVHPGAFVALAAAAVAGAIAVHTDASVGIRASVLAGLCLWLWLTEWVPVWVPTLLLWTATPLLLGITDARFASGAVLRWSIDPVLALFFGGFALAAAVHRHGIDHVVAAFAIRRAGGSAIRLVAAAALATALLSMWMSNVAAAALILGAFRPLWDAEPRDGTFRRALLLAIALAADFGGIATPIGTGPNGIAMAAVAHVRPIGFLHWMAFGLPLALALVVASIAVVIVRMRPSAPHAPRIAPTIAPAVAPASDAAHAVAAEPARPYRRLAIVFGATVLLWLTEPLHGVPAWIVALGTAGALLVLRVLSPRDLLRIDWATLLLVAGGIGLGGLLDRTGVMRDIASALPLTAMPPTLRLLGFCLASALLAAVMSNTGTAALLIPLASTVDPAPSTAIIVAVASSLGVPFVVSTPPNAMAVASGLRSADLLVPGLVLMLGGCVIIAFTGPWVLRAVGVP